SLYSVVLCGLCFVFSFCSFFRNPHSFPTRRSSDLVIEHDLQRLRRRDGAWRRVVRGTAQRRHPARRRSTGRRRGCPRCAVPRTTDRKSTRLNSSHVSISYAVFCLKKKNK